MPAISVPVESLPSTVVLPLLFAVASSPLICVPVPPLVMALSPSLLTTYSILTLVARQHGDFVD
ncbi:hypothetical protein NGG84_21465 [Escherichia coli]|uniref:hypothetical protein n=1 Tax=Escherichia coli TaxID=562 RepID=UPI0013B008DB|nr:hypothetical protein [Escherichia coli]MEB8249081.1 hypothetical protein [Escherichia coli]